MIRRALPVHGAGPHGDRHRGVGGRVPDSASRPRSFVRLAGVWYGGWRVHIRRLRAGAPAAARLGQLGGRMADHHSHGPVAKKVMVAVGGQSIDAEVVRLACSMTEAHGGKIYGVHIIEVNRSLPLGAVMDEVVERAEKILDEVEQLATEAQLNVETELVQARDTGRRGRRVGCGADRHGTAVQATFQRVQPWQDSPVRSEERELPGASLPRAPRAPGLKGPAGPAGPSATPRVGPAPYPSAAPAPACTPPPTLGISRPPANPAC